MMIGGGVATPPETVKPAAAVKDMVIDGIVGASVSASASASDSPAPGSTRPPTNNNNNNDICSNNNNNDNAIANASATNISRKSSCCQEEDAPTGLTRPWEPPSPTHAQNQSRSHMSRHHSLPQQHHHQQIGNVPTAPSLIDGLFNFQLFFRSK